MAGFTYEINQQNIKTTVATAWGADAPAQLLGRARTGAAAEATRTRGFTLIELLIALAIGGDPARARRARSTCTWIADTQVRNGAESDRRRACATP